MFVTLRVLLPFYAKTPNILIEGMKRIYVKMVIVQTDMELESNILTGSKTTTKIDINTVEVEEFSSGFGSPADIEAGRDFTSISFDYY